MSNPGISAQGRLMLSTFIPSASITIFSSYFRLRFRLPQRKLNQKSTARTDNMIIHLHLFVTILQTQSANFACCNNLFIQTCIFAVHSFCFSAICDFEFFSSHFAVNMTFPCLVMMFVYFLCTNEHPFSILPQNHNISTPEDVSHNLA